MELEDGQRRRYNKIPFHFRAIYVPELEVFTITAKVGDVEDSEGLSEEKFREFLNNLPRDGGTISIGTRKFTLVREQAARVREYLELVLESWEKWESNGRPPLPKPRPEL